MKPTFNKQGRIVLPEVNSRNGAPKGRPVTRNLSGPCYFQKVSMSPCGAYDHGGAYWGIGDTLYVAMDEDHSINFYRGSTRKEAVAAFHEDQPDAWLRGMGNNPIYDI